MNEQHSARPTDPLVLVCDCSTTDALVCKEHPDCRPSYCKMRLFDPPLVVREQLDRVREALDPYHNEDAWLKLPVRERLARRVVGTARVNVRGCIAQDLKDAIRALDEASCTHETEPVDYVQFGWIPYHEKEGCDPGGIEEHEEKQGELLEGWRYVPALAAVSASPTTRTNDCICEGPRKMGSGFHRPDCPALERQRGDLLMGTERTLPAAKLVWFLTECCDRLIQSTTRFCPACGWECRVKALHEQRYQWGMP